MRCRRRKAVFPFALAMEKAIWRCQAIASITSDSQSMMSKRFTGKCALRDFQLRKITVEGFCEFVTHARLLFNGSAGGQPHALIRHFCVAVPKIIQHIVIVLRAPDGMRSLCAVPRGLRDGLAPPSLMDR